ncbi:MAG: hypothetical protein U0640_02800 [Phycisphaerales bacterium]
MLSAEMQDATTNSMSLGLSWPDWVVLAVYFGLLLFVGWWANRRGATDGKDYFLAARSMPAWAVAFSILSTAQSAATFIGVPENSYLRNMTYLATAISPILAAWIVQRWFLPRYYALNVASPYEMLEYRFGRGARVGSSVAYLVGRLLGTGARTFIGALPLSLAIFGDVVPWQVCVCIGAIMIVGTLYSLFGGVRSVIWSDVLQVAVYTGAGVVAAIVLWNKIPLSFDELLTLLSSAPEFKAQANASLPLVPTGGTIDKLTIIDVSWNRGSAYSLWAALTGLTALYLATMAVDQDLVQRSLTCKDAKQAGRSVLMGQLLGLPVIFLFLVIGLLLYAYHLVHQSGLPASKNVFQAFILEQMPPAARGLMIAGVLAIGPIGVNSTLNSMASTLMNDWLKLRRGAANVSGAREVAIGRMLVICCGVALCAVACLCAIWQNVSGIPLLDFAIGILSFAYAGLLGVFLCAVFTKRGTSASAIAALVLGAMYIFLTQKQVLGWIGAQMDMKPATDWLGAWAFGWHLLAGTAVSFAACAAARGRSQQSGT